MSDAKILMFHPSWKESCSSVSESWNVHCAREKRKRNKETD